MYASLLGLLNRTTKCKDTYSLVCFYKSLVRPHLEFCLPVWSSHYATDKVLIEKVQRRFTRMISHLRKFSYEERLRHLKLWTLEDRRIRADLIAVYKIIYDLSIVSMATFFELDSDSRTWGHVWKFKKKRSNSDLRHHFFSERVINWWNRLKNNTVCASSVNSFKKRVKDMWNKDEFAFGH